ncbi:MAG: hypothetical protein DRQ78_13410 [Epsilonproteobacteria bacterium]|nr:MAG: hypothetical protein DRQ78_13410 [Campylobacterota bacterium]
MKIILGKNEVENAIECYLKREGINTAKYDLDIKIVVSRSSEDTKIEVDLNQVAEQPVAETEETPAYMEETAGGSPFGEKDQAEVE